MNNSQFLDVLKKSFLVYLNTGARSNKKLEVLHGSISEDISERFGDKRYEVFSLGYNTGKEHKIYGRYVDKAVDITITEDDRPIAGIAVKYVMSNYSQNSNNYFENMLGETANIRAAKKPYFQIFVIPDKIPYFDRDGNITKWEHINAHNLQKYIKLSDDNTNLFLHTPNKTLVYIIHIKDLEEAGSIHNKLDYVNHYTNCWFEVTESDLRFDFGDAVIYNDYEAFINKVVFTVKGL